MRRFLSHLFPMFVVLLVLLVVFLFQHDPQPDPDALHGLQSESAPFDPMRGVPSLPLNP